MTKIAIVCGSFHKDEIERMLEYAKDQASKESLTITEVVCCLLYTSPSPRDRSLSRMPSSA